MESAELPKFNCSPTYIEVWLGHPQPGTQSAPHLNHQGIAQAPHSLANLLARQCQHLINHDLRDSIEAVLPRGIESDAKQRRIDDRAGQRHDGNAAVIFVENIGLYDQGRPRFPVVPRRRYRHDVAALQVQPSTDPAATLSKSSNCAD